MITKKRAIELLKSKDLYTVSAQSRIKNIADELDLTPLELYKYLRDKE